MLNKAYIDFVFDEPVGFCNLTLLPIRISLELLSRGCYIGLGDFRPWKSPQSLQALLIGSFEQENSLEILNFRSQGP